MTITDYLDVLLDKYNNIDISGLIIIFQVVYQLWTTIFKQEDKWRNDNSKIIEALETNYGENPVYRLGQFEAICSKGDDHKGYDEIDKLEKCKNVVMQNYDRAKDSSLVQMWFDTLICYREREITYGPLYNELCSIREEVQEKITYVAKWEEIAMSFHSKNKDHIEKDDPLYKSWKQMRESFEKVIDSLPKEYSRTLRG